jgi:hypothetical protein
MCHLATILPAIRRINFPLSRGQVMLLMLALNELLLGFETFTAHIISGTVVPNERIPIWFGTGAGILLLAAGLISYRKRSLAVWIANIVFVLSIVVGLMGAYFHVVRGIMPDAAVGEKISIFLLVWSPPILGPLTFSLIGLLGISTVWLEDPAGSGVLRLWGSKRIRLPYSKTRAYFFMVGMGNLATVISSVMDHARTNFTNPWLWLATSVGIFGAVAAVMLGMLEKPRRSDLIVYAGAMVLMILTGFVGMLLHIQSDLAARNTIVIERFLRGAPPFAPMLFADMGAIGLIALLKPDGVGDN